MNPSTFKLSRAKNSLLEVKETWIPAVAGGSTWVIVSMQHEMIFFRNH